MKRILITGASGFIGSTLADHALAKGWEVTAAIRPTSDREYLQDPRLRFLYLSFDDPSALREALESAGRFDFVVHNAGTTKALNRDSYFRTNETYTRHLVEALHCDHLCPAKFLFVSSLAAMGPALPDGRIRPGNRPFPVTHYGASKLAAEQYLESLTDFPWVAVQPTAVFGPRDKDVLEFVRLVNAGLELYIGTEPQPVSFIYVNDLATLIFAALEQGQSGRKYIAADGRDYTTDDLGRAVRQALQRRTIRLRLPLGLIRVVATLSELVGRLRGQMPPLNRDKLHEIAEANWWTDVLQTFEDLPFTPRYDLFSGMQETIAWYRQHHWI